MGKKTAVGCACLICGKTIKIGEKTEWVMVNRRKAFAHFDCLPKKTRDALSRKRRVKHDTL